MRVLCAPVDVSVLIRHDSYVFASRLLCSRYTCMLHMVPPSCLELGFSTMYMHA